MSAARLISAVFPGKCYACGAAYAKGAPIYYAKSAPAGRKAWCSAHGPHAPRPLDEQTAAPLFNDPKPAPVPSADYLPVTLEGKTRIAEFDSLSQYVAAAAVRAESHNARSQAEYFEASQHNEKWHGIATDEATGEGQVAFMARMLHDGWPRGVSMLERLAADIAPPAPPVNLRRRRAHGDQGDSVDMGRVWSGDLSRAWSRTTRTTARAPRNYTIHINPSQPWFDDAQCMVWRSVAGLILADMLTTAGYSVEIRLTVGTAHAVKKPDKTALLHSAIVKPAGAPLDLQTLAAVAHPLMVRAVDFSLRHRSIGDDKLAADVGYAARAQDIAPEWFARHAGAYVGEADVTNEDTARAWIAARLADLENPEALAA